MQDGIVAMKVIITMLENLKDKIDSVIPVILQMIVQGIIESNTQKTPPNYVSMLL